MAQIDIIFEDPRWIKPVMESRAKIACDAVFAALSLSDDFEVSILACDDARISALNNQFRDKSKATNVLSWPSVDRAPQRAGETPFPPDPAEQELGDIAISYDTCAREAGDQGIRFDDHVTHLLVHGVLHLLGFDHETDQDAALMEGLETQILAKLGVEDPY